MPQRRAIVRVFCTLPFALAIDVANPGQALADEPYFPPGVFDIPNPVSKSKEPLPEIGKMYNDWYAKQLMVLREASLLNTDLEKTIYRFTWLRSFEHPMVFRLTQISGGRLELTVKRASGKFGYEPDKVDLTKVVILEYPVAKELMDDLDRMRFWAMRTNEPHNGLDGANWLLEGTQGGLYHVVHRWSPSGTDFSAWCLKLMRLSGVALGEVY
jgi:hypothetical protein